MNMRGALPQAPSKALVASSIAQRTDKPKSTRTSFGQTSRLPSVNRTRNGSVVRPRLDADCSPWPSGHMLCPRHVQTVPPTAGTSCTRVRSVGIRRRYGALIMSKASKATSSQQPKPSPKGSGNTAPRPQTDSRGRPLNHLPGGNWPSTTGKPSGEGRSNADSAD